MPTSYAPPPRRVLPPPPPPPLNFSPNSTSKPDEQNEINDERRDAVLTKGLHARMASLNLNQVGLNPPSRPTLSAIRKASRTSSILSTTSSSYSSPSTPTLSSPSSYSTLSLASTASQSSMDSQLSSEIPQDQLKQLLARKPPVPPPPVLASALAPVRLTRPISMHVTPTAATSTTPASPQLKAASSPRRSLARPVSLFSTDQTRKVPVVVPVIADTSSPALSPLTTTTTTPTFKPNRPLPAPPPPPPSCTPSSSSSLSPFAHANQNRDHLENKFVPGVSCIKCYDFSHVDMYAKTFAHESVTHSDKEELVHTLIEPFDSETEKARALFAWFYHTTSDDVKRIGTPDVSSLNSDATTESDLEQVFVDICARFADFFVDLARRGGLEAYFVWGYSKPNQIAPSCHHPSDDSSDSIPPFKNNDAWVCVKMDDEWHLIVPTWGRGFVSESEDENDSKSSIPSFVSRWFTSTPLEFRHTHFPEDPNYQLVSEENGGSISWETFISTQTGPRIKGEFHEYDLNPGTLQPHESKLDGGQFYTFSISKRCTHFSRAYEDNYCFVLFSEALETAVPLVHDDDDNEDEWSVTIRVPSTGLAASGGTIGLGAVWTVAGQDAKGLKPERFAQQEKIRNKACIRGLVEWDIV